MSIERMLPQSIEAECGVLGSLILDPDAISQVADFLHSDDFYRDSHKTIYETILKLYDNRIPADPITICEILDRQNKLESIGNTGYITDLINSVPTSGNVEYYGRIVWRNAVMRRLAHSAGEIAALAYSDMDAEKAIAEAEQIIYSVSKQDSHVDFSEDTSVLSNVMLKLFERRDTPGALSGLPTGFTDLDKPTGGLQRSDLIILAARPGVGKTSFAMNIVRNTVVEEEKNVAVFSLEMSEEQLMLRMLSMESKVGLHRLRNNQVEDDEWERLTDANDRLSTGRLFIDATSSISLSTMRSRLHRLHSKHPLDLIVVDYLQLMTIASEEKMEGWEAIGKITAGLKGIAKEFNVPVLALSQLSRASETRQTKMPQLSDLRGSGNIEQDADIVLFIYREDMYNPDTERKNIADIIIAKHRNGPVCEVTLHFNGALTLFQTLEVTQPSEGDYYNG